MWWLVWWSGSFLTERVLELTDQLGELPHFGLKFVDAVVVALDAVKRQIKADGFKSGAVQA